MLEINCRHLCGLSSLGVLINKLSVSLARRKTGALASANNAHAVIVAG
jgi:hypothetical protein